VQILSSASRGRFPHPVLVLADHLFRHFFKKRGGGKGDWGSPGDELLQAPIDPRDPMYDDFPDAELDAALHEHLFPDEWSRTLSSPFCLEDLVEEYECPPIMEDECLQLNCDIDMFLPAKIPVYFGLSESPKGSWFHAFHEPTPLKLPANAVWSDAPLPEVSTHCFFE
jgi:hypothetical protein